MTTERLANILGIPEWPMDYNAEFERFKKEWETVRLLPVLEEKALQQLVEDGFVDEASAAEAIRCARKIEDDEDLLFALQCVYYALCEYRGPHQNELYIEPVPPSLGDYRYTFSMIVLIKCMITGVHRARERGISEELLAEHKGAANGGVCEGGHIGTPGMFHWRCVCAFCTMYSLGILRFEPERVPPGYRMLRRKADGKLLMLYTAARSFDEYGQFVWEESQTVFTSKEATGRTDGYLIAPDGRVVDRYLSLSEEEWETAFDGGDAALSFHIPPKVAYNAETIGDSFRKAVEFFGTYYPELAVRSIQSYSWLYSPQLSRMLPETSGINRLNRELYLAPVPSGPDGFYSFVFQTDGASFDLETAPTDTSLRRAFVEFVKAGGRVHNGFMYLPAADAQRFGEDAHTLYAWDLIKE